MFTIVVQLVDKVGAEDVQIPAWRAIAADRSKICSDKLRSSDQRGKQILLEVANGASPKKYECRSSVGQEFLQNLANESRILRWLACSQMSEMYKQYRSQSKDHWPEATVFSYWWTAAEDYILQHMLDEIRRHPVQGHVSCHFDGVLLGKALVDAIELAEHGSFIESMQRYVLQNTGLRIQLKEKTVRSFPKVLIQTLEASTVDPGFGNRQPLFCAAPSSLRFHRL